MEDKNTLDALLETFRILSSVFLGAWLSWFFGRRDQAKMENQKRKNIRQIISAEVDSNVKLCVKWEGRSKERTVIGHFNYELYEGNASSLHLLPKGSIEPVMAHYRAVHLYDKVIASQLPDISTIEGETRSGLFQNVSTLIEEMKKEGQAALKALGSKSNV